MVTDKIKLRAIRHPEADKESGQDCGNRDKIATREEMRQFAYEKKSSSYLFQLDQVKPQTTLSTDSEESHKNQTKKIAMNRHQQNKRRHQRGLLHWPKKLLLAKEHGGDYYIRLAAATRAALGSFAVFALLVFTNQKYLGAVWIGNIFMHSSLGTNAGSSFLLVKGFSRSIILTTGISWPFAYLLTHISGGTILASHSSLVSSILLPPIVSILSFLIMCCPQLTSRNLMILVMYMVVASPISEESLEWWSSIGYVGAYHVGLAIALIMNLVPLPDPNFATTRIHDLLTEVENDTTMLLLESEYYTKNTGHTPEAARAAVASIQMLHARRNKTVKDLKKNIIAAKPEMQNCLFRWFTSKYLYNCNIDSSTATAIDSELSDWIAHLDKQTTHFKMLNTALKQRILGEEFQIYSPHIRNAKSIIAEEVGPHLERLVEAMVATFAVCDVRADPYSRRQMLPTVKQELHEAVLEYRRAFNHALMSAGQILEGNPSKNVPVFAHLARRMTSFTSMTALGEGLEEYLQAHYDRLSFLLQDQAQVDNGQKAETNPLLLQRIACKIEQFFQINIVDVWWTPKWLWREKSTYRLAIKTSVGMFIASLWVAVPYLWEIAKPFGVWPGLTIASVNLATTGSSFHKAGDRLFGTLLAAGYALLVADFFPGNKDAVKIPAIALFTFVVIYLRNADHAYKYTYAATSIGSMLYGSFKNDFNIAGYVPKRIQLIFVGVCIFIVIELMLIPRSSRKIVEKASLQFFYDMQNFLTQATETVSLLEDYVVNNDQRNNRPKAVSQEDDDDVEKVNDQHKYTEEDKDQDKYIGEDKDWENNIYNNRDNDKIIVGDKDKDKDKNMDFVSITIVENPDNDSSGGSKREGCENCDATGDPFRLQELIECQKMLKLRISETKKEIDSGLEEPNVGMSQSLEPNSFRGIVKEQTECEIQSFLLLDALQKLANNCYQVEQHQQQQDAAQTSGDQMTTRTKVKTTSWMSNDWLRLYGSFLREATEQMEYCSSWLKATYPDGFLRAQRDNNALKAVTAGASFRGFEQVRLHIISQWSQAHRRSILCDAKATERIMHIENNTTADSNQTCYYDSLTGSTDDDNDDDFGLKALVNLGITTSFILELCRHTQQAGKHLEELGHNFPSAKSMG